MPTSTKILEASIKEHIIGYYDWIKASSIKFNKIKPYFRISISELQHYEELENYKKTMFKHDFEKLIENKNFDKNRLRGDFIIHPRGRYNVTTRDTHNFSEFDEYCREVTRDECEYLGYVYETYDFELPESESRKIFIDAYFKLHKVLEKKIDFDDIPNPPDEDVDALIKRKEEEAKEYAREIEESWKD